MRRNTLGQTGIKVSAMGLGTVKFGRTQGVKYPAAFELPDEKKLAELLEMAKQLGINLLDTAPAYGSSEERLGKLLKGQRNNWIISTKWGEEFIDGKSSFDFSKKAARHSIERSLRRLQTDWLDIVLVHSDGNDIALIENDVFDVLLRMKEQGLIRAFGMSVKTVEGGKRAVEDSDVVMVTCNPLATETLPVIAHAHVKKKGIFIKKMLASGHINRIQGDDPVQTAMDFIFHIPGVSSVIAGTINPQHLAHNVMCAEQAWKAI